MLPISFPPPLRARGGMYDSNRFQGEFVLLLVVIPQCLNAESKTDAFFISLDSGMRHAKGEGNINS